MKLTIYIKNQKKPIVIVKKSSLLEDLYHEIRTSDIIKIGPVIFRREDFIFATEEEGK